jgi:histidinol-phosphate/aromatic aminotransferase/cobyric acid decarboxylase-like protein
MKAYGMPAWLRVTIGTEAQNLRLLTGLGEIVRR